MRVEICCPSCNKGYLLDETSLGGEFFCPACSTPIALSGTVPAIRPAAVAAAVAPAPAAAVAVAVATEVVCPRCNLHFAPKGRKKVAQNPGSRPTILVVEDMGYFQQIASDALSAEYEVKIVSTASAARKALAGGGIDLMVLDLNLHGTDEGLDLLRETRSRACPVLIYTARDESEMYGEKWDELRKLGADDIVIKGMNVAESLKRKAGALLGRRWDDEDDIE